MLALSGLAGCKDAVVDTEEPIVDDSWTAKFVDLGTLGGAYSLTYGTNDLDWIVGESRTADGKTHAVVWTWQGRSQLPFVSNSQFNMQDLTPNAELQVARDANNRGQIVGLGASPWVWTADAGIRSLPRAPGVFVNTEAYAISESGLVAGTFHLNAPADGCCPTLVWQITADGVITGPTRLEGEFHGFPRSINSRGDFVGRASYTEGFRDRAGESVFGFSWSSSTAGFSVMQGTREANGIDETGRIVGTTAEGHAYIWTAGSGLSTLPAPGVSSVATAVNEVGWAAGCYSRDGSRSIPVLWRNGTTEDLPLGSSFSEACVTALSNRGLAAGTAILNGQHRAVAWVIR